MMTFEVTPSAWPKADAVLGLPPQELFHRLLLDQESEESFLASRRILHAFLSRADTTELTADQIASDVQTLRLDLAAAISAMPNVQPRLESSAAAIGATPNVQPRRDESAVAIGSIPDVPPRRDASAVAIGSMPERQVVLRQRAPIGQVATALLDMVSQPATQPDAIVNRLYAQHFVLQGSGRMQHSVARQRMRALADAGVRLPEVSAASFLPRAQARPLTALHATFYLALSRLPTSFMPEIVGVHYVLHALGIDDLLLSGEPMLAEADLRAILADYLAQAGAGERGRVAAAARLTMALEREHVTMLAELAHWHHARPIDDKVAEIVQRHAPFAGSQHGRVRVGGRPLAQTFADPHFDAAAFVRNFRHAPQLGGSTVDGCRFMRAIKFGGAMFGIFDEREAATFREWITGLHAGTQSQGEHPPNVAGDTEAGVWQAAIAAATPADVVVAPAAEYSERELFHRLINIETHPGTMSLAAQRASECFAASEILFDGGGSGRYTDATFFEYSPEALYERAERIYWEKLVSPYRPLTEIPDRDEVIFGQKMMALGALIDGAWIHRTGNLGRLERESDEMLVTIYADEMGHGDLVKNHLALIRKALSSMDIDLPHIRDRAFMDQAELPDGLYAYALQQLCMGLFPDRFYNEILGYNLAIEMFGLGELRLHEVQKLRHHGLDDCYEQAHLTIDNLSAGHARQAADIIVSFLDYVRRTAGPEAVAEQWRRVWRGYASFAYYIEFKLVKELTSGDSVAELVI